MSQPHGAAALTDVGGGWPVALALLLHDADQLLAGVSKIAYKALKAHSPSTTTRPSGTTTTSTDSPKPHVLCYNAANKYTVGVVHRG